MSVAYHRTTSSVVPDSCIERRAFDAAGHLAGQWDARLWADGGASGVPNRRAVHNLSGRVLQADTVDAGWRMTLFGGAGEPRDGWDGRDTHRQSDYDDQLRVTSVLEQTGNVPPCVLERFTYAAETEAATNRCGRLIRHDDPAGSREWIASALSGHDLAQTRRFLTSLETPDWPVSIAERDELLEAVIEGAMASYTTLWRHDARGTMLSQTDAAGNVQQSDYDVAGQLVRVSMRAAGEVVATDLLQAAEYNAFGHLLAQKTANGITAAATYSDIDARLQRIQVNRPDRLLQDMSYVHDPVGNVLRIRDDAQPTDWFNGEKVEPVSAYSYDTLYRMIEASGRESVQAGIGPGLPGLVLPGGGDANRRRNYVQSYTYDAAGNLVTLTHTQAATRTMKVAERSNRSLFMADASQPPDLLTAFDANGNLLQLEGTQAMGWNARNQLQSVTQVSRGHGADDDEVYVYGGDGRRCRKVRVRNARAAEHVAQVRYLPGLEIRTDTATGEVLHVATAQCGRMPVRHLRWHPSGKVPSTPQWRYSVEDHLGSCTLEVDDAGQVISNEGYYPYGGTAWWAARNELDAGYKTIRYSGKERDATGLYCYGFRYYAPWLQRWINPDPAGDIDGLNLFAFVNANPVSLSDPTGLSPRLNEMETARWANFQKIRAHVLSKKESDRARAMRTLAEGLRIGGQELGETTERLIGRLENASLTHNFHVDALPSFLSGRLHSVWENLEEHDETSVRRRTVELGIMAIWHPKAWMRMDANFPLPQFADDAYLNMASGWPGVDPDTGLTFGALQLSTGNVGGAPRTLRFGTGAMFLKESAREYMTFTPFDSFIYNADTLKNDVAVSGNMYPLLSGVGNSQVGSQQRLLNMVRRPERPVTPYFEWQAHHPITFADSVESMAINAPPGAHPTSSVMDAAIDFADSYRIRRRDF